MLCLASIFAYLLLAQRHIAIALFFNPVAENSEPSLPLTITMPKHFCTASVFQRKDTEQGRKEEFLMWGQAGKDFPLVESESLQVLIGMHLEEVDSLREGAVQETGRDRLQD